MIVNSGFCSTIRVFLYCTVIPLTPYLRIEKRQVHQLHDTVSSHPHETRADMQQKLIIIQPTSGDSSPFG